MADKRINALTTTSASVGDDYFAIDGATNGTRALSAFSPTFGGNATVTGTLSSAGNLSVTGTSAQVILGQASGSQLTYLIRPAQAGGAIQMVQDSATANRWLSLGISDNVGVYSELMRVAGATGNILIPGTVASTTTSTGALVVGNGTSGGLGVGGALNVGGQIRAQLGLFAGSPPTGLASAYQVDVDAGTSRDILSWGDSSRVGLIRGEQDGSGRATLKFGRYTASTFAEYFRVTGLAATDAIVNIYGTTASTSTSSGALVVSGGVGVGGNINAGGYLRSINSSAANGSVFDAFRADIGADGTLGALEVKAGGLPSATAGSRYGYILAGDAGAFRKFYVGGTASGGAQVLIPATDASTSTSSGALVVSGGVGVAGAIYAGGDLTVDKTEPTITFKRAANTNLNIVNFWTGAAADFGIGLRNTTDSDLHIYNYGTSNDALKIAKADSLATFGGAVRTAAPSGGTAANWKLGSVATVSPTSPNRTIEVDIGGTIYYIHAKTTNN